MKVLLVCPEYPDTFWSFKHALRFVSKRAGQPPLGLLTVASLLPADWEKRLVDLSLEPLTPEDLRWADYVFLGGMAIQAESARWVIARCNEAGTKVVAGGPLFTARHQDFPGVDHFVLNEAEITLPPFLDDLRHGRPKRLYTTTEWADLTTTPLPMWELIDPRQYATLNIQYSRGCPYDCEFCDITVLFGHVPRTKSADQVIAEMEAVHRTGWRGHLFFVDDNFIGNKAKLKRDVLPGIIHWMEENGHPFSLGTEASLNLSDDPVLMDLMARAGFEEVFVGIESPNAESLEECKKTPNRNRDLLASVRTLQKAGLQVQAGFIVGFDSDPPSIFDNLIQFIEESGIVVAMVGLLSAPKNSRLHDRLGKEHRLLHVLHREQHRLHDELRPPDGPGGARGRVPEGRLDPLFTQGVLPEGEGLPRDPRAARTPPGARRDGPRPGAAAVDAPPGSLGGGPPRLLEARPLVPPPQAAAVLDGHHPLHLRLPLPAGVRAARVGRARLIPPSPG